VKGCLTIFARAVGALALSASLSQMACSKGAPAKRDAGDASSVAPSPGSITSAAGRTKGQTYQVDFQLGHPISHAPTAGEETATQGQAAVKPQ